MIIGVDIAKNGCGFAVADGDVVKASGSWDFSQYDDGAQATMFYRFQSKVDSLMRKDRVICVAYEEVNFCRGKAWARIFYGMRAVLLMAGYRWGLSAVHLAPSQIKKLVAGHGNASKSDVMSAVNEHYGMAVEDHNESDAIALCLSLYRMGMPGMGPICDLQNTSS